MSLGRRSQQGVRGTAEPWRDLPGLLFAPRGGWRRIFSWSLVRPRCWRGRAML